MQQKRGQCNFLHICQVGLISNQLLVIDMVAWIIFNKLSSIVVFTNCHIMCRFGIIGINKNISIWEMNAPRVSLSLSKTGLHRVVMFKYRSICKVDTRICPLNLLTCYASLMSQFLSQLSPTLLIPSSPPPPPPLRIIVLLSPLLLCLLLRPHLSLTQVNSNLIPEYHQHPRPWPQLCLEKVLQHFLSGYILGDGIMLAEDARLHLLHNLCLHFRIQWRITPRTRPVPLRLNLFQLVEKSVEEIAQGPLNPR